MESILGLVRIRVRRGINLAVRDSHSSDPYAVCAMGEQKVKTGVVRSNCNPVWNEKLTLSVKDPNIPITLTIYDSDSFTKDDKMGEANFSIIPLIECYNMGLQDLPNGTIIGRVQPNPNNCLSDESCMVWNDGKITQDMILRLKNVECGEVDIEIEWTDILGSSRGSRS